MTDETYTKRLEDVRFQIGSIWESVSAGNLSTNDILDELNEAQSDLAFIIDGLMDLELDELIHGAA
jgi:hypothetical protein|tara:strand:- start:223 stop:420 length:198 start_codon:yes stop_codon:yes gene_type:complete